MLCPVHPVTLSFVGYLLPALLRSLSLPACDHVVLERYMQDLHGSSRKDLPKLSKCPSRSLIPSSPVRCSALGSTALEQRLALIAFMMISIIITIPCTAIVQLCQHYHSLIPITVATQNIHSHMCIVYQFCIHVAGVTYSLILVRDHISDCYCYNTYSPYYACVDQCILLSSFITIPLTGA
jgi:hypothetical protein